MLRFTGLVLRLASIKSYDEDTLYHSVNVAVISMVRPIDARTVEVVW
jgi:hypothetical protein